MNRTEELREMTTRLRRVWSENGLKDDVGYHSMMAELRGREDMLKEVREWLQLRFELNKQSSVFDAYRTLISDFDERFK